jgi:predicted ABC-type ATPase
VAGRNPPQPEPLASQAKEGAAPARPRKGPPRVEALLDSALKSASNAQRPPAFILAGHNGSGKSTLWHDRLANQLQMPLVNADRLTASILPAPEPESGRMPTWAQRLRDDDERWQRLSQEGVQAFTGLIMSKQMPFAFETVFSHWKRRPDGSYESKADIILQLQAAGYFVVLLFVGLATVEMSLLRVQTRRTQGGHAVPDDVLYARYPRTQQAIRRAAPLADMALMFDNSRGRDQAFSLVRAQQGERVLFDCRESDDAAHAELRTIAGLWLPKVAPR